MKLNSELKADTADSSVCRLQHRKLSGFTLVELMVALTIGLIILAAVAKLFATSRATYGIEENLARVQETGRFAMEFLAQDIRMAGDTGCTSQLTSGTINVNKDCPQGTICSIVSPSVPSTSIYPGGLTGYKYSGTGTSLTDWTPALPSYYFSNGEVKAGTDVIIIQRADALSTHLTGNFIPSNANIQIMNTASIAGQIQAGDVLTVSDCKGGDIFQATNTSSGSGIITIAHASGNIQTKLTHSYDNSAEIMKLVTRAYYIGTGVSGQPALMRKELVTGPTLQATELVEGVEKMILLYGEDTDTDKVPNIYYGAGSVVNWSNVITVRVGILVHSLTAAGQTPELQSFDVAGTTLGPFTDNLRRRAFNLTIRIRTR